MDDHWACYRCSYHNSTRAARCEMCETPRLDILFHSNNNNHYRGTNNNDQWTCSKCRTNNVGVIQCISCGSLASGWTCGRCTLENHPSRTRCKACGTARTSQVVLGAAGDGRPTRLVQNHAPDSRPLTGSLVLPRRQDSDFILALKAIQESEAAEQWTRIVDFCKQNNECFVDDAFPPTSKSLRRNNDGHRQLPFVQWKRPKDIHDSENSGMAWTVYRNPNPSDIVQGYLGNCWFLSALALLNDQLLENIIVTKEICPQGVYQVRLCVDGQWTVVIVDDFLACDSRGKLMYSKAKRKQLWVPLIEKALAKVHGSYAALSAGTTVEGLAVLTGAPCESIKTPASEEEKQNGSNEETVDEELLWATLLSCKEAGFLMGASCGKGEVDYYNSQYEQLGLQARHAYSLLDVQQINGDRLLKLRNPWGHFEWNGAWSKTSFNWTPELRNKYQPTKDSEGTFWMPFEAFCQYFDAVDVCKLKKNYKELRMIDLLPPHCLDKLVFATHLTITETTEVDFVLYQSKTRSEGATKHGPLDILLVVLQKNSHGRPVKFVCRTSRQISPFVSVSSVLKPGDYLVVALAFNHWGMTLTLDEIPKCVVSMHSSKSLHALVSVVDSFTVADSLILTLLAEGRRRSDKSTINTYTMHSKWCGEVIMIENLSDTLQLIVKCDCTTSENVVCTRGSLQIADVIPPRHRQIIAMLSQVESTSGYSIKYSLCYVQTRHTVLGSWAPRGFAYHETHAPGIGEDTKGLHLPRPIVDY